MRSLLIQLRFLLSFAILAGPFFDAAGMTVKVLRPLGDQPSVTDPQGHTVRLYAASYALLISESKYFGTGKGGWRPLNSTTRELDDVASALQKQGFTVWRISDATGDELTKQFREFMAKFGHASDNRLLFFFSGHGYTNEANDFSYLVPVDASDPHINPGNFYSKALPIANIVTWAEELETRHALFVFDSCFSGSIFTSRAAIKLPAPRGTSVSDRYQFLTGRSAEPVRQFLAAGGPTEELPAVSIFVPLFLRALNGDASSQKDGYVTGKEIGLWIEQILPQYNPSETPHSGEIRDPRLSFGDIVFQPPRAAAPVISQPSMLETANENQLAEQNKKLNDAIKTANERIKRDNEQIAAQEQTLKEMRSFEAAHAASSAELAQQIRNEESILRDTRKQAALFAATSPQLTAAPTASASSSASVGTRTESDLDARLSYVKSINEDASKYLDALTKRINTQSQQLDALSRQAPRNATNAKRLEDSRKSLDAMLKEANDEILALRASLAYMRNYQADKHPSSRELDQEVKRQEDILKETQRQAEMLAQLRQRV